LPFTAKKLSRILKVETPLPWSAISETSDLIPAGQQIGSRIAFAKIEDEEIQKQIDKLEATKVANKAENKIVEPEKKRFSLMILLKWICV
jgi:methionyl-tRNA synthetase